MSEKTVTLRIQSCKGCPHLNVGESYSLDGFDRGCDWTCKKADKKVAGFVEWERDEPKAIPQWCPLRDPADQDPKTTESRSARAATEPSKVWLFRVTGPSFPGDWWGTTDGDSKADALARVRRRMRQKLFSEYGEGAHTAPGGIVVEIWEHDFFTVADGYL